MNSINRLAKLARQNNIVPTDRRLRDDIVSEYTDMIESLDTVEESVIIKDIEKLPVYKINEDKDFNDFLHNSFIKESEWKSKYRSKFINAYNDIISKLKTFDKSLEDNEIINYPDKGISDWDSKEMIKFMDNYKGGPNDREDGICTKALQVCQYREKALPMFKKKTIIKQLEKTITDCIPKDLQDNKEKMYFWINHNSNGRIGIFTLMAQSIIMNESEFIEEGLVENIKSTLKKIQYNISITKNTIKNTDKINTMKKAFKIYEKNNPKLIKFNEIDRKTVRNNPNLEEWMKKMMDENDAEYVCIGGDGSKVIYYMIFIKDDRIQTTYLNPKISKYSDYYIYYDIFDSGVINQDMYKWANDIINNEKSKSLKEGYAIDLSTLKYVVESEQCTLKEAVQKIRDVNYIGDTYPMYCIFPENYNESMTLESFINLNNILNESEIIPMVLNIVEESEFINEGKIIDIMDKVKDKIKSMPITKLEKQLANVKNVILN